MEPASDIVGDKSGLFVCRHRSPLFQPPACRLTQACCQQGWPLAAALFIRKAAARMKSAPERHRIEPRHRAVDLRQAFGPVLEAWDRVDEALSPA
jgi:hypothetical protein